MASKYWSQAPPLARERAMKLGPKPYQPLSVKLQTVVDLVDHLHPAHREPDQIEIGAGSQAT